MQKERPRFGRPFFFVSPIMSSENFLCFRKTLLSRPVLRPVVCRNISQEIQIFPEIELLGFVETPVQQETAEFLDHSLDFLLRCLLLLKVFEFAPSFIVLI